MKNIKELRELRSGFVKRAEEIQAAAKKDDRLLNDEEELEVDTCLAEIGTITSDIEAQEKQIQQAEKVAAMKSKITGNVDNAIAKARHVGRITTEVDWVHDPMCGYGNAGEFYLDVVRAGKSQGKIVSDKLKFLAAVGSDEISGVDDAHGAFLVPHGVSAEILKRSTPKDPTIPFVRNVKMDSPQFSFNARVDSDHTTSVSGGIIVSRRLETAAMNASRGKYEQITMKAASDYGMAFATNEQITDTPRSISALLSESFDEEFMAHALNEKIWGTGVGERQGVMNSPALISVTRNAGGLPIEFIDIVNIRARVWGYEDAIWLANHDTMPSLAQLSSGDSAHIWLPSARVDVPNILNGRPLFFTDYADTVGNKGDLMCINFREYLEGNYQQIQTASSIHVRFVENETAFRWTTRNDGRGWWLAQFTPPKSAVTRSPFVTLADAA